MVHIFKMQAVKTYYAKKVGSTATPKYVINDFM